jgi:hypothetical protein
VGRYWLDANVLIEAKNGFYSFDIAGQFWIFLEEQATAQTLCSSIQVYGEIMRWEGKEDDLVKWATPRRTSGLFYKPDKDVQKSCGEIGDYVVKTYSQRPSAVAEFLGGADPWIIAHAKCDDGIVVSHESRLDKSALVPKVPNVCHAFGIGCVSLPTMLKALKFKFGGKA